MPTLIGLLSLYAVYTLTVAVLVIRGQDRDRFPTMVIAVGFPFLAIAALIHTLLLSRGEAIPPCPHGLEEAEERVEAKRQILFRSARREPTVAKRWRSHYAASLERQAQQVRDLSIHIREAFAAA